LAPRPRTSGGRAGVILIDKAIGVSSRETVAAVQRRLHLISAGHCGTLDPLATGLLIVVAGRATRIQELLMSRAKEYAAVARLGVISATDDGEGPISAVADARAPAHAAVEAALASFRGTTLQVPPAHSAVRIGGVRAFTRARRGEDVAAPPRQVEITEITLERYAWPELAFRVRCGAGTYIRSLARDLGRVLGCGGYLQSLRRTASGDIGVERAVAPDTVGERDILDLEDVLAGWPRVDVDAATLELLMHGKTLEIAPPDGARDESILWHAGKVVGRLLHKDAERARLDRLLVPRPAWS
jgi:tRNA pseudouridine55 synthase